MVEVSQTLGKSRFFPEKVKQDSNTKCKDTIIPTNVQIYHAM